MTKGVFAVSYPVDDDIAEDGYVIDFFVGLTPNQITPLSEDVFWAPEEGIVCKFYTWEKEEFIRDFGIEKWNELLQKKDVFDSEVDIPSHKKPDDFGT